MRGRTIRDVTLLWALRSPCNLGCRYCYFGTLEEHRLAPPTQPGLLSHLSRTDLGLADIQAFLATVGTSAVGRVFVAGGEPLIWPHTLTVVQALKQAGVQVVVCTNGIPLNRPEITRRIIELGVDGVSVSLDSANAEHNDRYRPSRRPGHGWADVVSGIRTLLTARNRRTAPHAIPKVGLYAVITRRNISSVREVAELGADLGVDYYVPQPISLAPDHPLYDELALRKPDAPALTAALASLYDAGLPIRLPHHAYPSRLVEAISVQALGFVRGCFGGHQLFFIEPDGSVWDCPSRHKIGATPTPQYRSIRGSHAAELFGPARRTRAADCALFSEDCVNMWPLMGFERFLHVEESG